MDDPLIGLTIYDTTSKARDAPNSSDMLDGQRGSEDCFPCLPSIPDEDKLKTTGSSTKLESNVTRSKEEPVGHQNDVSKVENTVPSHQPKNFWLMRLFQSNLFDMSIAIGYLFNSKDHSVQSYLGNRLFVSNLVCFI